MRWAAGQTVFAALRAWVLAQLGVWLIPPLIGLRLPGDIQPSGFRLSVVIVLVVAAAVDFEFGRSGHRQHLSNLGYGRPLILGLAGIAAIVAEVAFRAWMPPV
jgi:hypothetical protein